MTERLREAAALQPRWAFAADDLFGRRDAIIRSPPGERSCTPTADGSRSTR